MSNKKYAFTLAEVLITLGVIGVVAILTIPSVMQSYQSRVLATQIKKAYNEVATAGATAMSMEMGVDSFKDTKVFQQNNFVTNYFKKTKDCRNEPGDCFASTYRRGDTTYNINSLTEIDWDSAHCFTAKAGYSMCLDEYGIGILDINGKSGPNRIGKDFFEIGMGTDGSIDTGYSPELDDIAKNDWEIE